jgi:hypothetical protein
VLKVLHLEFIDSFASIQVDISKYESIDIQERIRVIETSLDSLHSSTSQGFVNNQDLSRFPLVSEILPSLLIAGGDSMEYQNGSKSMESYKWIYNLIILSLYQLCLESLHSTDLATGHADLILDLRSLERDLYERLDPSIRHRIMKRGVSIKQNIYIGFDTEFTKSAKDVNRNTLVSAQLAVNTRSYIQIPLNPPYTLSSLDGKNKIVPIDKRSTGFNYSKVETSIQLGIARVRRIKYEENDGCLLILTETLRLVKGLSYKESSDWIVFSLPRSIVQPYIHFGKSFSFKQLLQISSRIANPPLKSGTQSLLDLIKAISAEKFSLKDGKEKLIEVISNRFKNYDEIEKLGVNAGLEQELPVLPLIESTESKELTELTELTVLDSTELDSTEGPEKGLSREYREDLFPQRISVTTSKTYWIVAHLTPADISLLSDFDDIKEELSIVNGSFVTLGKPIKFCGRNIHIRDTMLLAPGQSKALASIGKLYGGVLNKISISHSDLTNMQGFLERDRSSFIEYALRDSLISLIHASWMEDFNFNLGGFGIPLSLSSIGRNYVKSIWNEESYPGYQLSPKYLLGDVSTSITPKGLNVLDKIGFVLAYYTANYKGGRNECFMYGIDRNTEWFDYDLTSAYTTVMSMAGHPDYGNLRRLSPEEVKLLSREEQLYSYLIIQADFEFPVFTKYPSIPCYVDENCTVYPLQGSCIITGAEYILATSQGCEIKIQDAFFIPFAKSEYKELKPFSSILSLVQERRREYPKGSISNLMYKEIGNGIYGSVVRGIGNKRKFDIKSKGLIRMVGDELTNPLIASWTTAYIRSIIGECLHGIYLAGGKVVSVTTDGFITDLPELESKISNQYLFGEFKKIRLNLSGDDIGLEVKNSGTGIIAWTTRGQLGINSKIIATTGFQNKNYYNTNLVPIFIDNLKSESKTIGYVQSRLRSASDIYKKGGHVTMVKKDQLFRMHYDNRRVLDWEPTIPSTVEVLVDSIPLDNVSHGKNLRAISKVYKQKLYGKFLSINTQKSVYNNIEEIAIRNFIRGLLSTPPLYNLPLAAFDSIVEILDFIKRYDAKTRITVNMLQHWKRRGVKWMPIARSVESEKFINFVKSTFQSFDVEGFYTRAYIKPLTKPLTKSLIKKGEDL